MSDFKIRGKAMRKIINLTIFVMFGFFLSVDGQTTAPTPNAQQQAENQSQIEANRREQQQRQNQIAEQSRRIREMREMSERAVVKIAPANEIRNVVPVPAPKLSREQKLLLAPDSRDSTAYADFLKQPATGLTKLFPDLGCQANAAVLRADAVCLRWIPNSGFFSFRRKKYVAESLADISYKNGFFISDSLFLQGIMTNLGDIPIDAISLADEKLRFLNEYQPAAQSRDAAVQSRQIVSGVESGGYVYRSTRRAIENTTYALRAIAYRGALYVPFQGGLFNLLDGDARKDVIVIFRVVRKSSDGSITLLWKELDRRDAPKIIFPKKDKKNKQKDKEK